MLREESEQDFAAEIKRLTNLFEAGDGKSGLTLLDYVSPDNEVVRQEWRDRYSWSSLECRLLLVACFYMLQLDAKTGNGEAMHLVAMYYQCGYPPVKSDAKLCLEWCERAFNAGYIFAANDIYSIHSESKDSQFYDPEKAAYYWDIMNRADLCFVPKMH